MGAIENKYAVFINSRGEKVEIVSSDFDGDLLSKLCNYVLDVVDSLIEPSQWWFTVLNANLLMDNVCSLAVRKSPLPSAENVNGICKKYLIICFCASSSKGLNVFEDEISNLCLNIERKYLETGSSNIKEDIENWYTTCISYMSTLFAHYKISISNFIYWSCLKKQIKISTNSAKLTKALDNYFKYLAMSNTHVLEACNNEIVEIKDESHLDSNSTTIFIDQVVSILLLKHLEDPLALKYAIKKCIQTISEEFSSLLELTIRASKDYTEFHQCYLFLKNSRNSSLLISMLLTFKRNDEDIMECVTLIKDYIEAHNKVNTLTIP